MEVGSTGSVKEGSENNDPNVFDYDQDSDEEGCALADAFMQFEAQAEKRTQQLLEATDQLLFHVVQDVNSAAEAKEGADAEEGSLPAYVYTSDHFRQKKPPQFQHWQQHFEYLQVTGSRMVEGEPMEHIQMVPTDVEKSGTIHGDVSDVELRVEGCQCLQEPTKEFQEAYEGIILCDGIMEEILEKHEDADDEADHGVVSPHTAHVEGVLDALTLECFSSTVAPLLASFYNAMLKKQQQQLVSTAREEKEVAANRTIEEQQAGARTIN